MREIKPGWYLLLVLLLYCAITTFAWQRSERLLRAFRASVPDASTVRASARTGIAASGGVAPRAATRPAAITDTPLATLEAGEAEGLWFPLPGAALPSNDMYLPGALLTQLRGKRQGFIFYGDNAGVPIVYGAPVIAAADAVVVRADDSYEAPDESSWQSLLAELADREPSEAERDLLRGRQIWLRTDDGRSLRYGHLSAIHEGVVPGERVYRGQVIGFIGNSGTQDGVAGTTRGARLQFEIWQPNGSYLGQNFASANSLRSAAERIFVGP